MVFLSKEQVLNLFDEFEIIDFQENERDGKTGLGKIKHWHTFDITEITSPYGNPIKIYNAERSLCDILKNSNCVDLEVYNKIINNYFKQKHRNLITLEKYAEKLGVSEKLKNIMEVLI